MPLNLKIIDPSEKLPDVIYIPATKQNAYSGDYILQNSKVVTGVKEDGTPFEVISRAGDTRIDACFASGRQVGEAIRANDAQKLPDDVKDLVKNSPRLGKALFSGDIVEQEKALGFLFIEKWYQVASKGYDKTVAASLEGIAKASSDYERRLFEYNYADEKYNDHKGHLLKRAENMFAKEEDKDYAAADSLYQNKDGDIVEYTKNYGIGTNGADFICRHDGLAIAGYMASAGFKVHAFPCTMVRKLDQPGGHYSCISDVTGNVLEATTPRGNIPYLYNISEFNAHHFGREGGGDLILSDLSGNITTAYSVKPVNNEMAFDENNPAGLNSKYFIYEKMDHCQFDLDQSKCLHNYNHTLINNRTTDPRSMDYKINPENVFNTMMDVYQQGKFESKAADMNVARMQYALVKAGALEIVPGVVTVGYHTKLYKVPNNGVVAQIGQGDIGHADGAITMTAADQFCRSVMQNGIDDLHELQKKTGDKHVHTTSKKESRVIEKAIKELDTAARNDSDVQAFTTLIAQSCGSAGGIDSVSGRIAGVHAVIRAAHYDDKGYDTWQAAKIEGNLSKFTQDFWQGRRAKAMENNGPVKTSESAALLAEANMHSMALEFAVKYIADRDLPLNDKQSAENAYKRAINYIKSNKTFDLDKAADMEKIVEQSMNQIGASAIGLEMPQAAEGFRSFEMTDIPVTVPDPTISIVKDKANKTTSISKH